MRNSMIPKNQNMQRNSKQMKNCCRVLNTTFKGTLSQPEPPHICAVCRWRSGTCFCSWLKPVAGSHWPPPSEVASGQSDSGSFFSVLASEPQNQLILFSCRSETHWSYKNRNTRIIQISDPIPWRFAAIDLKKIGHHNTNQTPHRVQCRLCNATRYNTTQQNSLLPPEQQKTKDNQNKDAGLFYEVPAI